MNNEEQSPFSKLTTDLADIIAVQVNKATDDGYIRGLRYAVPLLKLRLMSDERFDPVMIDAVTQLLSEEVEETIVKYKQFNNSKND